MNWRLAVLAYVVCSVVLAGYLFTQVPSAGVSGCTMSEEDMEREWLERITCPAFLALCVLAVLHGLILLRVWCGWGDGGLDH